MAVFPENCIRDPSQLFVQVIGWMEEKYHCALSCYLGRMQALADWEKECELLQQADERFAVSPGIYTASQIRHTHPMPFILPNTIKCSFLGLFSAGKYAELLQKMQEYFLALTPEQCNTASLDAAIRRIDQEFERGLDTIAREQFQKSRYSCLRIIRIIQDLYRGCWSITRGCLPVLKKKNGKLCRNP